ncbi:MAG: isopentenyl phosphate kinase family protein [Chloroflexi bacterium]|nr:MAG: isopentenyl phosphate kinase family protein [Chloroflexota bacterium]
MKELIFLKLGGSLITDKTQPYTPKLDVIEDVALQISTAFQAQPDLRLVIGHGSGSFGHVAATEYHTRDGFVPQPPQLTGQEQDATEGGYWKGFAEVWYQASALNRFVMKALHKVNLPAIALPPSANVIASDGKVSIWEMTSISMALASGLVPVIYGDVTFDEVRGGTILSTEDLFSHLARALNPDRILLAGLEAAVWEDFPARTRKIETITPESFSQVAGNIEKAAGADVTGGMKSKVTQMLELVQQNHLLKIQIFSGAEPGNIVRALTGETLGTWINA